MDNLSPNLQPHLRQSYTAVSLIEIMEPPMIEFMGPFFHRFLPPAGT